MRASELLTQRLEDNSSVTVGPAGSPVDVTIEDGNGPDKLWRVTRFLRLFGGRGRQGDSRRRRSASAVWGGIRLLAGPDITQSAWRRPWNVPHDRYRQCRWLGSRSL